MVRLSMCIVLTNYMYLEYLLPVHCFTYVTTITSLMMAARYLSEMWEVNISYFQNTECIQ